jgi:hypothetical protein
MSAPTRQKIAFGEMRAAGVRGLLIYCADYPPEFPLGESGPILPFPPSARHIMSVTFGTAIARFFESCASGSETSNDVRLGPAHVPPGKGASGRFNDEGQMWGFLIGLYLAMAIYPFIAEWQQRRANRAALKRMRLNHASGRRWNAAKGQWENDEPRPKPNSVG